MVMTKHAIGLIFHLTNNGTKTTQPTFATFDALFFGALATGSTTILFPRA